MATASSVIGSLQVNITAATHGLEKGLHNAHKLAGGFVEDIKTSLIGALAALPFAEALKHFVEAGEALQHLSEATGVSVGELAFLQYGAEQTGTSLETLTKAARELQSKGIDPNRFEEIAASIAAIQDPTQRAQSAMYYFGKRSALALLPLINNLPALKERFEQLGGGLTDEMVKAAEEMGKSWGDLKLAFANISNQIAFVLAPYVTELSEYIAQNGQAIKKWIGDHKYLILALSAFATAVAVLTPILFVLTTALGFINTAITATTVAFTLLAANPAALAIIAIGLAVADLILLMKQLHDGTINTVHALSTLPSSLGGVGGYNPAAHFSESAITPDGTAPAISPTAPSTTNTAPSPQNTSSMNELLQIMNKHLEKIAGNSEQAPSPAPLDPLVFNPSRVR